MAKNITLAIDEDLLDKVRVLAAMRRTSVNAMVREYLEREIQQEIVQANRAEVWGRLFEISDQAGQESNQPRSDGKLFDREEFYQEVMRERGLL